MIRMKPSVHLNGTSAGELMRQTLDAHHAIGEALEALGRAAPNARDYYPQGNDAYGRARAEHESRLERLRGVQEELLEIGEHIAEHMGG